MSLLQSPGTSWWEPIKPTFLIAQTLLAELKARWVIGNHWGVLFSSLLPGFRKDWPSSSGAHLLRMQFILVPTSITACTAMFTLRFETF